jgi:hypothetical protein
LRSEKLVAEAWEQFRDPEEVFGDVTEHSNEDRD